MDITNKYNNNVIIMNRGDTFKFDLTLNDNASADGRYHLKEDDALYLGIMDPHQPFEVALVRKKYTVDDCDDAGNLVIKIEPKDTLDLLPGTYYYAVKLKMGHYDVDANTGEPTDDYIDDVITVIHKTKFFICD